MSDQPDFIRAKSCADDYDPEAMSVDAARKYIRAFLTPVSEQEVLSLRDTLGRVLAQDVISPCNVPNHDNSAMDGYAFNSANLADSGTTTLKLVGTAFAGKPFTGSVGARECVRIMTGAVIPSGTDTVIMQERVHKDELQIHFEAAAVKPRQNVRKAGEDLQHGQVVLPSGHKIRPADLGLIASLGIGELMVFRRLRVAFFSTGDELASIGKPLQEGQVYDSNRYTIHGMLTRLGVEIIDMGVVPDNPALLEQALLEASRNADTILSSGGVSVGEADYMKQLLNQLGEVVFWKISLKPGRPLAYGKVGKAHYFGLPGNPVAVMVTFYQFVREALLLLMGEHAPKPVPLLSATCSVALKKAPGRTEFQRGILSQQADGQWLVRPTGNQGSGILRSMSEANCFIVLEEARGNVSVGEKVQVQVLEGLI